MGKEEKIKERIKRKNPQLNQSVVHHGQLGSVNGSVKWVFNTMNSSLIPPSHITTRRSITICRIYRLGAT